MVSPQTSLKRALPNPHSQLMTRLLFHWENRESSREFLQAPPIATSSHALRLCPQTLPSRRTAGPPLRSWGRPSPLLVRQTPPSQGCPEGSCPHPSWPWIDKAEPFIYRSRRAAQSPVAVFTVTDEDGTYSNIRCYTTKQSAAKKRQYKQSWTCSVNSQPLFSPIFYLIDFYFL